MTGTNTINDKNNNNLKIPTTANDSNWKHLHHRHHHQQDTLKIFTVSLPSYRDEYLRCIGWETPSSADHIDPAAPPHRLQLALARDFLNGRQMTIATINVSRVVLIPGRAALAGEFRSAKCFWRFLEWYSVDLLHSWYSCYFSDFHYH